MNNNINKNFLMLPKNKRKDNNKNKNNKKNKDLIFNINKHLKYKK